MKLIIKWIEKLLCKVGLHCIRVNYVTTHLKEQYHIVYNQCQWCGHETKMYSFFDPSPFPRFPRAEYEKKIGFPL